jgi:hypothetical protein
MTTLDTLLTTHRQTLQDLLGTLPLSIWKVEQYGPLTKYTLGQMPDGRWSMLHHLTAPDKGLPHDHPVAFTSTILVGGYRENVYHPVADGYRMELVERLPGNTHDIAADCIHQIVELPEGECWSLCLAGPVVREWRHYSLEELRRLAA